VKRTYDSYRKKYFLDHEAYEGHVKTPPTSSELRWRFLPETSSILGETTFDEDEQPYDIALNRALLHWPDMMKITLLHEMTHMRIGLSYMCLSATKKKVAPPAWKAETTRLAALGAPLL
jgi:hypothetical protein